jgi:hypothetical protein
MSILRWSVLGEQIPLAGSAHNNPSLTGIANAPCAGDHLVEQLDARRTASRAG